MICEGGERGWKGGDCLKNWLLAALKLGVPAALFVYLLWSVDGEDYEVFWAQDKRWGVLAAAQTLALAAILLSFARWWLLVRAFEIPFSIGEALRLGFLGYLFNFISFGSVGGDLFKAVLVARDKPQRRPEAVASVLLDRAFGLLGLVVLAFIGLTCFAGLQPLSPLLAGIRNASGVVAMASVTALVCAVFAGRWFDLAIDHAAKVPVVGDTIARMARAVRLLRKRPLAIPAMMLMSIAVHALLATTLWLISAGVYTERPTLAQHLMVVPPGMAAGALPLAPGGLGLQEGALSALFEQLVDLPENFSGMLIATIYRLITIAIAGIGLAFYWTSHGREFTFAADKFTNEDLSAAGNAKH